MEASADNWVGSTGKLKITAKGDLQWKSLAPTKSVSRVHISPKSKHAVCNLCLQNYINQTTDGNCLQPMVAKSF